MKPTTAVRIDRTVGRVVYRLHRWMYRLTGGLLGGSSSIGPMLLLTTTGRRSGLPRSQPLQYVRDGDDLIVIASNWGGEKDPAWSWNLRAEPKAQVTLDGRELPVVAREAEGDDRERLWRTIVDQWPGYEAYRTRASHRRLRIFRLTPSPVD